MRLISTICLTAALAAGPFAFAQPPSLMSRLDRYCVGGKAVAEVARKAARADGFVTPPPEMIPALPADIEDLQVLWTVFDGGVAMLLTGAANDKSTGMTGDFCAVASMPQSQSAIRDLESWVGAKIPGSDGYVMFADEKGGRRVIKEGDQRALLTAVRDENLRMAGAKSDRQMTILMLVALRL